MSQWASPIDRHGTSGEAIVLIHGFTGHAGHWLPMVDHLHGRGHTVVAPLLTGHGTSPADLAGCDGDAWVESVRGAVEGVADHRRTHLVGLSMGGIIGVVLAAALPVASLTTINSPVRVWDRRVRFAPMLARLVPRVHAVYEACPDPDLDHLWSPYDWYPSEAVAELVRLIRVGLRSAPRVDVPALVVQSRADTVVRPESAHLLANRLRAEILWLETARHNALLDPERHRIHEAVTALVEGTG